MPVGVVWKPYWAVCVVRGWAAAILEGYCGGCHTVCLEVIYVQSPISECLRAEYGMACSMWFVRLFLFTPELGASLFRDSLETLVWVYIRKGNSKFGVDNIKAVSTSQTLNNI